MKNGALNSSLKDLRSDLQSVARDAEALLKATADVTGEHVDAIRARTQQTVNRAYDHLNGRKIQRRVKRLARDANSYVRDNSWGAIGIAVGIGLLIGLLSRRD